MISLARPAGFCGLLLAFLAPAAGAQEESGFVSLFNGKDLEGWEGDSGAWAVREGEIRCLGGEAKKNWLIWRGGEPADFELRLRFRYEKGNSGVQVRSKEIAKWQVRGYQVEVAPREQMGLWHHSLAPAKGRSHLALAGQKVRIAPDGTKTVEQVANAKEVQAACRPDGWNDLAVTARGPRLVQIVNGVIFSDLTDEDAEHSARAGLIALQDHGKGTVVAFKDIRLKILGPGGDE